MVEQTEDKPADEVKEEVEVEEEVKGDEEEQKDLKFDNLAPEFIENLEEVFRTF